ncbi:MAG: AAA family ATPase [Defluviitaleaceae bacterium]|nr:AAA family ATPase [Defluviitaleaceae bacterium]
MQRTLMKDLVQWKDNPNKKPLIVQGVRQCGKTYLIREFGRVYYDDVVYCNFDEGKGLRDIFEADLNPRRIIKDLSLLHGRDIKPANTLVVFDEIQSCGRALSSLKYFCEDAPEYHVVAAGSLLGVAIPKGTSFPVGKVEFLTLYPMNFYEFLLAQNQVLAETLEAASFDDLIWHTFKSQLEELYRDFHVVGGMPEVVKSWIDTQSIENVEKIQSQIIQSYENDFAKHAPVSYFPKLSAVWNAIPSQLSKENRKFIFSQVKKSWRAKDLEDALEWLVRAGLVYRVESIEKPAFPLKAYANHTFFKLYMSDIGILRKMANLPPAVLFDGTNNYQEFKGAMAENFVCCELKKAYSQDIYYWTAEGSARAEVDFIVQDDVHIVPIGVKAKTASHARSLSQYIKKFTPEKSVLTSLDKMSERILPLYAFWRIRDRIDK